MKIDLTRKQIKFLEVLLTYDKSAEHTDITDYPKIDRIIKKLKGG